MGSLDAPLRRSLLFIVANLAMGITFSTLAQNQLQAMQMALLLLPALHPALRVHVPLPGDARVGASASARSCRSPTSCASSGAFCLRETAFEDILAQIWPIALFAALALVVGVVRYRRTLD